MATNQDNATYQRVLDAAAELFSARGYEAVTLRDIGNAVNIKHASLYYYAPEGKQQLYMAVMERAFQRHRAGITQAIAGAEPDIRHQLRAVGHWLVSQPPMNMSRVIQADTNALGSDNALRLSRFAYDALREPLVAALGQARADGRITLRNLDMGALTFLTMIEVVHSVPSSGGKMLMDAYIDELIEMLMRGWEVR
jgi:AcrR family transcriptional regulator